MPRAWDEREKDLVRLKLREEGRKQFEKYGLRKTTVDDIVRSAGISKGAFYLFHASKEEFYFDILESMERDIRARIFACLEATAFPGKEVFREFLMKVTEVFKTTPMLGGLNGDDYQYLLRKLPDETLKKHIRNDFSEISRIFNPWMEKGWMRKVDGNALSGLFALYIVALMNRDESTGLWNVETENLWIDMMTEYLIPGKKKGGRPHG